MTFYPRPQVSATYSQGDANAINLTPVETTAPEVGVGDVLGAAFRQENVIGSLLSYQWAGGEADPSFNAWDSIKGTDYEDYWDRFTGSRNSGQAEAMKRQIDMELSDRRTIAAAGGWGILASIGAGVFSPENLLPAGTFIRGARLGTTVAKSALSTASYAALSTAAGELALQATQETRTAEESVFAIGGGAVLGGLLGGSLAGLFARQDFSRLGKALEADAKANDAADLAANERAVLGPSDAGAAARPIATLEENTIAGRAAQIAGGAVRELNPVLRILHSPSAAVRDIGTRLFENPVYVKKNFEGVASAPGVETLVKEYTRGRLATALDASNKIYREYRKLPGALDRDAFNEAVGKAMRRGDEGSDPAISQAAKAWRSQVFDPLKQKAIEAGLLPKDVSVDTAMSYFTRVYNKPRMIARENEFKAIVRSYIRQEVKNAESRALMARLDPSTEAPKTEPPAFVNDADRQSYVDDITDNIFNTITGKNADGDIPRDIVPATRGPLKERTFHIPDHMIEDFLESNVEAVGRRYARVMAADVELKNAFGGADMKDAIKAIRDDYTAQRSKIDGLEETDAAKEKLRKALDAREKADVRDIQALRDLIRGSYLAKENSTNYARVARVAGTINYLRLMGGVTLSSAADVARHVMVHGFSGVMKDGLVPLIGNLKGFRMAVDEARLAGAVTERLLNTRMATWADINDPYSVGSPFERFMENTANGFSRLNGLVYWNDFQKSFASVITQNRVVRNALDFGKIGAREKAYMAYLGIDGPMAERIAKQFDKHGTTEDGGVRVAHTDDWEDEWARRTYRAAINKDVDSTIISKGVGDVPLFMNTPTGRLLTQFKGFALASHQRALMRGLQERPLGFLSGSMFATTVGMLIYYLKAVESNRTQDISDNPGRWIAEGLDRSGLFSIAFEVNNTVEKAFGIGAYGALAAAFPQANQQGKASKYTNRSIASLVAGPTGDLLDTMVRAGNAIKGSSDGWTEGDIGSIKRLLPGATLPGIRSLVEYAGMPAIRGGLGID